VPTDLIELDGKTEIQRALGTSDRREAERNARRVAVEFDAIFEGLRAETPEVDPLSETDDYDPNRQLGPMTPDEKAALDRALKEEASRDPSVARLLAQDAKQVRKLEKRQQRLADIEEAVRRVLGKDTPAQTHNNHHSPATPPATPQARQVSATLTKGVQAPVSTTAQQVQDKSLRALARHWEKARTPGTRSAAAFHRTVERFIQMVGDIPVPKITKLQVVAFKDAMVTAGIGATAINAALDQMQTLCRYAIGQAWIDTSPATGVRLEVKKRSAKGVRPPFDVATLNRIFSNRIYTEGYRPAAGRGEAAYWLPLLGVFTGARVEELCQLRPEDLYEEDYRDATGKPARCWVLRLVNNEEHGQGVKNVYSVRRIPLHLTLIELGFIAHVKAQTGKPRIFHELRKDKHGVESSLWSAWWIQRMLRAECAPTSPKMVYHSFRHTWKDVSRECGISKELADAIQGHSEADASSKYGGEFFPLRPLVDAMNRFEIHGLELPS
jgi:integrase